MKINFYELCSLPASILLTAGCPVRREESKGSSFTLERGVLLRGEIKIKTVEE